MISKSKCSSRKEVVHTISLIIPPATWDVEKILQKIDEKVLAIMKIAKFRPNISISEKKSLCDDRNR